MSLTIYTDTPRKLNRLIREAAENGDLDTWSIDTDGDFTHTPDQWRNRAWMHTSEIVPEEKLIFGIIGRYKQAITKAEYAVYHGRFAEMLLTHFDRYFRKVEISAMPTRHDHLNVDEE